MKIRSHIIRVRIHVARVLNSCETMDQLNACEFWFSRLSKIHPDLLFDVYADMFKEMYMVQRRIILKRG